MPFDVLVARDQRPELGRADEIEIDAVVPRVAAAAVLDDDAVRLVLLVRLHARRAQRAAERICERLHAVAIGEEALVAVAPRVEQRHHDVARRSAPLDDLQELAER